MTHYAQNYAGIIGGSLQTWLEQNQTPFLFPGNKTFSIKSDVWMVKRHSFCHSHQRLQNIHPSERLNYSFTIPMIHYIIQSFTYDNT